MSKRARKDSKEDCTTKKQAKLKTILDRLNDGEVIIGDGGYITEMERRGYAMGGCWTPEANIEHPDAVEGLHKEFVRAGSDILQACTYKANDHIEKKINNVHESDDINEAGCKIVSNVSKEYGCMWAGCVSWTYVYRRQKERSKEEIQKIFRDQTKIFVEHDADLLIAEYFNFCEELEWAVEVLKETGKPVAASMCINSTADDSGVPTEECAVRLVKAGADIVGINCKFDPYESIRAVVKMKEGLDKAGLEAYLAFQPLGFHCPDAGNKGYLGLPEYPFALEPRALTRWDVHKITRKAYDVGARYIGGCCGFKAYHIRAIAEELAPERGRQPTSSEKHKPFAKETYEGVAHASTDESFWMDIKPSSGRPLCSAYSELLS